MEWGYGTNVTQTATERLRDTRSQCSSGGWTRQALVHQVALSITHPEQCKAMLPELQGGDSGFVEDVGAVKKPSSTDVKEQMLLSLDDIGNNYETFKAGDIACCQKGPTDSSRTEGHFGTAGHPRDEEEFMSIGGVLSHDSVRLAAAASKTITALTPMELDTFQGHCLKCGKYGNTAKECRNSSHGGAEKPQCALCGKNIMDSVGHGATRHPTKVPRKEGGKVKGKRKKGPRLNEIIEPPEEQ